MHKRIIVNSVRVALGLELIEASDPAPTLPAASAGDEQSILATEMQRRAGRTLDSLQVKAVTPGHQHYPPPKRFNVIGQTVFVRDEDAAELQAAILRRRATSMGKFEV